MSQTKIRAACMSKMQSAQRRVHAARHAVGAGSAQTQATHAWLVVTRERTCAAESISHHRMAGTVTKVWGQLPWLAKAAAVGAAAWAGRELLASATEKSLKGEVAVITGAGSGIGRLMALKMAAEGARIACWDINAQSCAKVVQEITDAGGEARPYVCDVSDREAVYALADKVRADFGRVDIMINNAGIVVGKRFLEVPDALAVKVMEVNTILVKRNHGHLVSIASAAGQAGVVGLGDYCASKFGAVGFIESMRMELRKLGKDGVHTTCVCPFYIKTGMFEGVASKFPLLPLLEPEYVASRVVQAIKRNSPMICLPRLVYLTPLLKGLLPVPILDWTSEVLGISDTMNEFKGRSKL